MLVKAESSLGDLLLLKSHRLQCLIAGIGFVVIPKVVNSN